MNTANLQLEGLCLAIAMINRALVSKNLLSREEVDAALKAAEDSARRDGPNTMSSSNHEAVGFPIRLLRQANTTGATMNFSELTRLVADNERTAGL